MDMRLKIRLMFLAALTVSVFGQAIRLVSPLDNGVGRLEVFHEGTWGTVCDDNFGAEEAKVACRQLGRYESGLTPKSIKSFGFGAGKIWLDDVNCAGTESSLANCSHRSWGAHNCEHSDDVGIICDPSNITMKLTPGYRKGLLQVFHSGSWGTVCDDYFGQVEASVVCRALGHQGGKVIDENSSIKMWLDDVTCTLMNTDLKDCKHRPWGSDDCGNHEAVGVECFSFPEEATAARLFSSTSGEGVLELYYKGQWGSVDVDGFGLEEATVACRMLGHNTIAANVSSISNTGSESRRVIVEKVQCIGTELSLNDCIHYPWGNVTSSKVVQIQCPKDELVIHLEPPGSVHNVFLGQAISVKCVIGHTNALVTKFRWTHSGGSYSGHTFKKTIKCKSDTGTLTCNVQNVTAFTLINVIYPPEVHLEPSSDIIDIGVGEDLRVQCVVDDANPNVQTFRWSHNGRTTTGSTFLKRNVIKSDQGQLTCTADNGHMMTPGRADATVNVRYPPKIHLEPNKQVINVKRGGDVTVVCVVDDANPSVTSYTWSQNNNISHDQVFTKGDLSLSDAGNLSCSATNGQGTSFVMTKIIVSTDPPKVHMEPSSDIINVGVGEDLRVQCVVDDANPNVQTFRWSHNGRTTTGSTFLKRNVTKSDQGQLTCTADNGHMMTPGRADATVNVRYPPEIHLSTRQDVISVMVGNVVEVECVVDDANPAVTYYLWRHNRKISYGQTFLKHMSAPGSGNLSCSATNRQGTATVQTSITVLQASSLIGNDETISIRKMTVIAIGSVGVVTILLLLLLIIIIYQRMRRQTANPIENPQRTAQTSMVEDEGRQQNYETLELQSGGAENAYCTVGIHSRNDAESDHIYGNHGFEDEATGTASGTSHGDIQLEMSENIQKQREPIYENKLARN